MKIIVRRRLEIIKNLLKELDLPGRFVTNQTAICILALSDGKRRDGLLTGKAALKDGARIHDVLEFARRDLGIRVAENTRESYRKTSLKPLYEGGLITRHQLSTNDPNTFYRLHPDVLVALDESPPALDRATIDRLRQREALPPERGRATAAGRIRLLAAPGRHFSLGGGDHNELERAIVERYAPTFLHNPRLVFLGDAARKTGYQDRTLMRELNLPIEVKANLPDVILLSQSTRELVVAEAVVSTGIIDESRLAQLVDLTSECARLGFTIQFLTAFPSRSLLRRFADQIAWGTAVWVAAEPNNLVLFQRCGRIDSQ
jgi:BsuBI/PstI restriction endonuclease